RITPATTVMMMPRITKTMEIITFRECAAPKAFRPRMTKMAPTKIKMKPMTPMYGSQPIRVPTRMSRTPVFVRSICLRRSASHADGSTGIATGYIGAAVGGAPDPDTAHKALQPCNQNRVHEALAATTRGQVTLTGNDYHIRPY